MCDSFVATPEFTQSGRMILAKNSDREPNEAQAIVRIPAKTHSAHQVQVTYITVPQVKETHEVLLSKPFQMWGAEMGTNEYGLGIVNEAVFTKVPFNKDQLGLTGMDMLRLALERTRTAQDAMGLITELLEEYGQDVCGGYRNRKFYYHNSFILADAHDAIILETAGKHWAARKVKGFGAISNGLSIEEEFDWSSPDLVDYARKKGWIKAGATFSFREAYAAYLYTRLSRCMLRRASMIKQAEPNQGKFGLEDAIEMLKAHAGDTPAEFTPAKSNTGYVCMHSTSLLNPSQTTGAMISELRSDAPSTVWMTGTSASCISVFKPFSFPGKSLLAESFMQPGPAPDLSLWWRHENLHRRVLLDYGKATTLFSEDLAKLQAELIREEHKARKQAPTLYSSRVDELSESALKRGDQALSEWTERVQRKIHPLSFRSPLYRLHWALHNQNAGITLS